jgi:formylglycine-generating enzyme required for sulfatase activity
MHPHLLVLLVAAILARPASAGAERVTSLSASEVRAMARIPAGSYRPLYGGTGATRTPVAAFLLDRTPVTRGDFQRFIGAHPSWRRGVPRAVFADAGYLAEWPGAANAGDAVDLHRPVTSVSWFAARAYCAAQGKRLPTVDEWEYVAAADERRRDASADPAFRRRVLALNVVRPTTPAAVGQSAANVYGVRDLHGVVWEWTDDFNSVVVPDDSRTTGSAGDARDHHLYCASAAIGASDPANYPAFARYAVRAGLSARSTVRGVGFRCAADLPA